ncbi:MAG: LytR C-terminal domain-containing protein [Acidimicrobiia bacterium]|nr:LytR C-terminal domain-containing protein [Acidimicrobiia bacterium]
MIDRIERHDFLNAAALALALLFCGYLAVRWLGLLGVTLEQGLWKSEKVETIDDANSLDITSILINGSRPPNEVSVRVGNGSDGRTGLAGRATERLGAVGYGTLPAENKVGDPSDESFVFFAEGFVLDARQVAAVLDIPEANVRQLGAEDVGVTIDGADVIVVLGNDAAL